jgi:16S rRNA (guanine966-N2)-methyltransferase
MGGVEHLRVADLYCGSGAMGVEALSRGAASVTFVDHERSALETVRSNLRAVGLAEHPATVVRATLPEWLARAPTFDLALCDPPYRFDRWPELLGLLRAGVVVMESAGPVAVPAGWEVVKARHYGGTLVTVARSTPARPDLDRAAGT